MNNNIPAISLRTWGVSDVGRVRNNNEDSYLMVDLTTGAPLTQEVPAPSSGFLLMVADGMGGHEAGEVASRMAVETVSQYVSLSLAGPRFPSRRRFVDILRAAVIQANTAIYDASHADEKRQGMGTTLTAAGVYDGAAFFAQVGDSRAYVLRTNTVARMTEDQNLATKLAAAGTEPLDQSAAAPYQNVLLQALGAEPQVSVPVSFLELRRGDWIVVCSDGLTNLVGDEEIRDTLWQAENPQVACHTLVETANARGGRDNITVIAAYCNGPSLPAPQTHERFDAQTFVHPWWYRFVRFLGY
jgi:PPM family protein phosphatase